MKFWLKILFLFFVFTAQAKKKVACIGDSVTKGYLLGDSTDAYPSILQNLLGQEYDVQNFGYSGSTLLNNGHRPYIKTVEYQKALNFKADIVIISLGLNDTDPRNWPNYKHEFWDNYTSLIQDFRKENPKVEIYICKLTPIFSGHKRFLSGTRNWFDEIQSLIPEIAKYNGVKLIDNHSVLAARIDLFEDDLHPNEKGAKILAENIFKYLKPVQQRLSFDEVFGDFMVLQRNKPTRISGKGNANAEILLRFDNKNYKNTIDSLGNWSIEIPSQKAGGSFSFNVSSGNEKIELKEVLFGDVYLASGQSNMAFPLKNAKNGSQLLANPNQNIRVFKNKVLTETQNVSWSKDILEKINNLEYFSGKWEISNTESLSDFSAIAYAAALDLYNETKVPIGIIDISVGGSNIESWIPRKVLENDNLLATYIRNWKNSDFVQDFCRERAAKNSELSSLKYQRHPYDPAYNFESGLEKFTSLNLSGFLWYQGESNAHNIEHHQYLFPTLVDSWRKAFVQNLPFYFVQLSSINRPSWPDFRESQRLLSETVPNTFMAISYDKGHPTDVHPEEKIEIGKRLAALILQNQYSLKKEARSPHLISIEKKSTSIFLRFDRCKSLETADQSVLKGLEIVLENGKSEQVENYKISKNSVEILTNKNVKAVKYAFEPYTEANLISDSGVPVSTFYKTIY